MLDKFIYSVLEKKKSWELWEIAESILYFQRLIVWKISKIIIDNTNKKIALTIFWMKSEAIKELLWFETLQT